LGNSTYLLKNTTVKICK